jgi:hypothetical protein
VSRNTYLGALDQLLIPLGFQRQKRQWRRQVGDMEEVVDLEKAWTDGAMTASVKCVDLVSQAMLREANADGGVIYPINRRIGYFIGPRDKWWKKDSNGPAEVAEIVKLHALPFLESFRTLEAQATYFGRAGVEATVSHTFHPDGGWRSHFIDLGRKRKPVEPSRSRSVERRFRRRRRWCRRFARIWAARRWTGSPEASCEVGGHAWRSLLCGSSLFLERSRRRR